MPGLSRKPLALLIATFGCLPADPPDFVRDAGPAKKVRIGSRTQPVRTPASASAGRRAPALLDSGPVINEPFVDAFERAELGADWHATASAWRIEEGRLCGRGARNHPVWLRRRLPVNARIEFDATSGSPEGDLKAEAWGDGKSAATGLSYDNATSYLFVLGGWKNQLSVLARLNEHGRDRLEVRLLPGSEDPRTQPVVEGKTYHVEIERSDGRTVTFSVDDTLIHEFSDPAPLKGPGHEHFAFNDWEVPVCFDDLKVTPLEGS
jgi:hypothetical protein